MNYEFTGAHLKALKSFLDTFERKVDNFMTNFPKVKIICMARDPRVLYVSGVENWRHYQSATDNSSYPLCILWRNAGTFFTAPVLGRNTP